MARFEIPAGQRSWVERGRPVVEETPEFCIDTDWLWLRVTHAKGTLAWRIARAVDVYLESGGLDIEVLSSEVQLAVRDYISIEQERRALDR